jgi:rhomboid protease GluP
MFKNLRTVGASIVGTLAFSPAAVTLAVLSVCFFVIHRVASGVDFVDGYSFGALLTQCFGLHAPLLAKGFVWQAVTYLFLHGNWLHLALNMLTVLLFGAGLEMEIGGRRFWTVFLAGGVIGGLGWMACDAVQPALAAAFPGVARALALRTQPGVYGTCIGASGGVFALIGAYAALFPRREAVMLVLVFPVRMRARTLAVFLGLATIIEAVLLRSQIAYTAHLAGGVAGYLYGLGLLRRRVFFRVT